jgi:hypothetical protein
MERNDKELNDEWLDKIRAGIKSLHDSIDNLTKERDKLQAKCDRFEAALTIVQKWQLPSTGKFWDKEETQPMSYEAAYGSNGAREFMRNVANEALSAGEGEKEVINIRL